MIALNYEFFKQILLKTLKENKNLFYNFIEELFSKISSY